jgi:hypothetical protein
MRAARGPEAAARQAEERRADRSLHVFADAVREVLGLDPLFIDAPRRRSAPVEVPS